MAGLGDENPFDADDDMLGAFTEAAPAAVPAAVPAAAPAPVSAPAAMQLDADFFAAPASGTPTASSAAATKSAVGLSEDDPRLAWQRSNAEALAAGRKAEEEAQKKAAEAGKAMLDKLYEAHKATVAARRETNRSAEAARKAPAGIQGSTAWEKIFSVVDLNFDKRSKDVARFKEVLKTCKAANVQLKVGRA